MDEGKGGELLGPSLQSAVPMCMDIGKDLGNSS
eukprot:CAMPEP_0201914090 /NCGR_PEP_ID=MMETSP0903-20130614/4356_1 /ASSEMBLY_ACC=CAM_ASM_000552 /TAXON_ID=420261 /ORGANISM="Thalassiosira antarctica, Strain CCMP982" /LENGTH=32 /DNA_ID= /DNA_START= /DNA_END= /DNA_ORIENTATION=